MINKHFNLQLFDDGGQGGSGGAQGGTAGTGNGGQAGSAGRLHSRPTSNSRA